MSTVDQPQYAWNDSRLVADSNGRRRRYRLLQSWYREHRLHAPHGWTEARPAKGKRQAVEARPVGNLLREDWAAQHPTGNFLFGTAQADIILKYVEARVPVVRERDGTLETVRLYRNLLSSMPLCFNLFAPLRAHPAIAADLLAQALGLDIVALAQVRDIKGIECEWAPDKDLALGDRTAFDAVIAYLDSKGRKCLLGVETKYTETFSRTKYGEPGVDKEAGRRASYQQWTDAGWFRPGAADRLWGSATNQLWRNVMLGVACESFTDFDRVDVAVISLEHDPHADAALQGVREEMDTPDRLHDVSLEHIMGLAAETELADWAGAMTERYLDLSVVAPKNK